jgi:hypothetical protein
MKRLLILAAVAVPVMGLSAASAQYHGYHGHHPPYYGGATTESAWRHGFADIVRSAGAYNLMTSEALVNIEVARKKNIENRLQWTQTYFEMRRINDEYRRAGYERERRSAEYLARIAHDAAPKRLTSSQLDPITGYVAWPLLLLTPDFADLRRELDRLFTERATNKGAIGNDTYFLILDRTDQMKERLRKLIKSVPPPDYIEASRFLESLTHEARFAAS